jgi:hypothetical protein
MWNAMAAWLNSSICTTLQYGCRISLANNDCSGNVPGNVVYGCMNNNNYCRFGSVPNLLLPFDIFIGYAFQGSQELYNHGNAGYLGGMSFSPGYLSTAVAGWITRNPPLTRIDVVFPGFLLGTIPASLNSLTALTWLKLDSNTGLTGTLPDLSGMSSLSYLSMTDMAITGTFPSWCTMPALNDVEFSRTPINGTLPACVATAMSPGPLRVVHVDATSMSGAVSPAISSLCNNGLFGYSCNFGGTSLSATPSPDMSQITASIASLNATLSSVTATLAALQVNLSTATSACSAAYG